MKKTNSHIFYSNSESCSENLSNIKVPVSIFRQELITWSHTKDGINKTTLIRNFSRERHIDSFISEPIIFDKDLK